jgi:hypothetical protein
MRLSEERIASLARRICDTLLDEELIDLEIAEERFTYVLERLILEDLRLEDQIDDEATEKLRRTRPHLKEGTPEWEIAMERVKEDLAIQKGYVIR